MDTYYVLGSIFACMFGFSLGRLVPRKSKVDLPLLVPAAAFKMVRPNQQVEEFVILQITHDSEGGGRTTIEAQDLKSYLRSNTIQGWTP